MAGLVPAIYAGARSSGYQNIARAAANKIVRILILTGHVTTWMAGQLARP
jgi:hypothetical protein